MAARIHVEGFKSIREANLELRPLNLLVGANGAGKSNLIQVFGLLSSMLEERLQLEVSRAGGAGSLLHLGPKATPTMRLELEDQSNAYEAVLSYTQDDSLVFESEACYFRGPGHTRPYRDVLGSGHRESRLATAAKGTPRNIASWVLSRLSSWKVYHFHDTSTTAPMKRKGKLDDNEVLRPDASNVAAFVYRLQQANEDSYRRIVAAVRLVAPFFKDFSLRPDRLNADSIQLEWAEAGSDGYFNGNALSDGTMRFICLAVLLLQPKLPSMIIIDEPELGLHPYAITQLAAMLKSASTKSRVVVATQSVTLMNQFEPDDLVIVERDKAGSVFRRVGPDEVAAWMDDYALGDIWEKNVIGGRPTRP